ncbi:hypothetical protein Plec18167_008270 [Paecilomyces lecythidis]|uniref:Uncharacterized protein n=1 Tax=Paecilomyces lecythidis TaxID=3004212 RepID=A0ABR3WXD5_9EURO
MAPGPLPQQAPRQRMRWLRVPSCKRISICLILAIIPVLLVLVLFVLLPAHISISYDAEYFRSLESHGDWRYLPPELRDDPLFRQTDPWNEPSVVPLIKDITQLSSMHWLRQMEFHEDWTAEYPAQEFWIYAGGSPKGESPTVVTKSKKNVPQKQKSIYGDDDDDDYDYGRVGWFSWRWVLEGVKNLILDTDFLRKIFGSIISLPGPSCVDSPDICHSFNSGFDRLLELYHTHRQNQTANTGLTFVDCDVSPYICDEWGVNPVMLIHVRTSSPCRTEMSPFRWYCSVKWHFVALPLRKLPVQRTVRLSDLVSASSSIAPISSQKGPSEKSFKRFDPVVPVFPSAFEQLHSMVSYSDSVEALEFQEHEILEIRGDL